MESEKGFPVELYMYDLTNGFASLLSSSIIGRQVEGVWHTSIMVYDREFFYGSGGIASCGPGTTQLGPPHQVERLGETFVPFQVFVDYVQGLANTTYTASAYRLLEHNCNHFCEEVAQFLCGAHVPKHIVNQADALLPPAQRLAAQRLLDTLAPPSGQSLYGNLNGGRPSREESPDYLTLNTQVEEARAEGAELDRRRRALAEKAARRQRRRQRKHPQEASEMAEAVEMMPREQEVSRAGPSAEPDEPRPKPAHPPIVFADIDGAHEFEQLSKHLEGASLSAEERQSLDELRQYLVLNEGSWVLGDDFLAFIGRLLNDSSFSSETRVSVLRCLGAGALREDVSLVLHQDRRAHALLGYAHRVDTLPLHEQRALGLFICNLFENVSSSEWLLYISEWECNGQQLSNIRATTKVCVHCALSEDEELRDVGTALMYNIASKEVKTVVFDEVCVELCMALLQLLSGCVAEEAAFRALAALARLAAHSADVPQLVALVGPPPNAYRGTSPRVDEQIDLIMKTLK